MVIGIPTSWHLETLTGTNHRNNFIAGKSLADQSDLQNLGILNAKSMPTTYSSISNKHTTPSIETCCFPR